MQLHTIKRNNPNKKSRQIGRGTTRGKTAGRGTKGQKARAGHKMRPELRDIIKKLPKRRGYGKNRADTVYANRPRSSEALLAAIERYFENNEHVTPATLVEKGIVRRISGKIPPVKIIGNVVVTKKLTVSGCTISAGARASIEKAGGSITG